MGGKNDAPPPPDYTPIAQANEASAKYAFEIGKQQLAWAREQYANDRQIVDLVVNSAMRRQDVNDQSAAADRRRYEQLYQPLEDTAIREARDFASPERERFEMARAEAAVAQQAEAARRNATQNLESYGVDPSSTRFAALDLGARVQQAAAQAGAGNQARAQTEAVGRALRSEAINVGRGYPGQVAGTYGTALQSGNSAVNSALAGTASGANTMGTGAQWTGMGNQALGNWGNAVNQGYQNQLAAFNANQQASSGIGSLLGAGVGLLGMSTQGTLLGGLMSGAALAAEGGSITPGGNVPTEASPTRGQAIDDVPARLTAGEFVVPKDVASWKGEEFFQKLIDGSRKAKESATAKPKYALVPPQQPTFASRPVGALPTR